MVRQDRFINARALTVRRMRNWYGMRASWKTINNRLLSRGYRAYRTTRKPLFTANHHRLHFRMGTEVAESDNGPLQHVIFGGESRLQLYPADGKFGVRRLPGERFQRRCQAYRIQAGGGWPAHRAGLLWSNFFGQPGSVSNFPPFLWVKLWVGWVGRGYTEISRYFPASWINWVTLVTKIKLLYSLRF